MGAVGMCIEYIYYLYLQLRRSSSPRRILMDILVYWAEQMCIDGANGTGMNHLPFRQTFPSLALLESFDSHDFFFYQIAAAVKCHDAAESEQQISNLSFSYAYFWEANFSCDSYRRN